MPWHRSEDDLLESVLCLGHKVLEIELGLSDLAAINFTEHTTSPGPGAALTDSMARSPGIHFLSLSVR